MAVPGYQEFMLPLLRVAGDGQEHKVSEAMEVLARDMGVSAEDQNIMLPSGTQTRYSNRVSWAVTYLTKSLLLEKSGRGRFRIAPRGAEVLRNNPARIDDGFLARFPEFIAFKTQGRASDVVMQHPDVAEADSSVADNTPEERLEAAYQELRDAVADDLQRRLREGSPRFFEHLVIRLLVAMGYGGGQVDRAEVTGKSGDDGIDGVIREDRLGLDMVYVQAKKWDNAVGPGEIDRFVGSLMRKKATKGVFITSGTFTEGAQRAAKEAAVKVRLIDGDELAGLMIDFNVGVAPAETYVVKKVDTDFFEGVV